MKKLFPFIFQWTNFKMTYDRLSVSLFFCLICGYLAYNFRMKSDHQPPIPSLQRKWTHQEKVIGKVWSAVPGYFGIIFLFFVIIEEFCLSPFPYSDLDSFICREFIMFIIKWDFSANSRQWWVNIFKSVFSIFPYTIWTKFDLRMYTIDMHIEN